MTESLRIGAFQFDRLGIRMIAKQVALVMIGLCLTAATRTEAQIYCPSASITNGSTADATQVMAWLNCKAPSDSPSFTGYVGVGTSNPAARLSITQTILNSAPVVEVGLENIGGGASAPMLHINNSTSWSNAGGVLGASRAILDVGTFGDSSGRFYSAVFRSNVGIGTTAPGGQLTLYQAVGGSAPNLDVRLDDGGGSNVSMLRVNQSTSWANAFPTLGASRALLDVGIYGDVYGTGFSAVFRGNVGIGTSAPNGKLTTSQAVTGSSPNLDIRLDDGSGTNISMLRVNQPTSWANAYPTLVASRALLDVGTFGDSSGVGYSAVFRGNVGIGTSAPAQKLEVNGQIQVDTLASGTMTSLCINANVISSCSSSIRYKENIRTSSFGLSEVMEMRPVIFKWKGRDEQDFGFVAEELAQVNPIFVTQKSGRIEGVKYPQLVAVLASAIKQQQLQLEQLKALASLQSREILLLKRKMEAIRTAGQRTSVADRSAPDQSASAERLALPARVTLAVSGAGVR